MEGDDDIRIQGHPRGLQRMRVADPFKTSIVYDVDFTNSSDLDPFVPQFGTRIIRVTDRQGYQQFVPIGATLDPSSDHNDGASADWPYMVVHLDSSVPPVYKSAGQTFGLEPDPVGDVGYEGAFLDAYWYHVVADANDDGNYRLVRDRLCASDAATAFATDSANFDPSANLAGQCPGGSDERVIIADRIVDFQVWFDCASSGTNGDVVSNSGWTSKWQVPAGGSCMDFSDPKMGDVRVAHIRLTLRAESERKNLQHYQFETSSGTCDPASPGSCDPSSMAGGYVTLRTFDAYPKAPGAAPVVTLASDVEMVNFAQRNTICP